MNSQLPPRSFRYRFLTRLFAAAGVLLFVAMLVGWVWTGLAGWR